MADEEQGGAGQGKAERRRHERAGDGHEGQAEELERRGDQPFAFGLNGGTVVWPCLAPTPFPTR